MKVLIKLPIELKLEIIKHLPFGTVVYLRDTIPKDILKKTYEKYKHDNNLDYIIIDGRTYPTSLIEYIVVNNKLEILKCLVEYELITEGICYLVMKEAVDKENYEIIEYLYNKGYYLLLGESLMEKLSYERYQMVEYLLNLPFFNNRLHINETALPSVLNRSETCLICGNQRIYKWLIERNVFYYETEEQYEKYQGLVKWTYDETKCEYRYLHLKE